MNILGNACLKEEAQQESMFRSSQTPKLDGTMHMPAMTNRNGSNLHLTSENPSSRDTPDMLEDLMQGLHESSPQFSNIRSENGDLCDTPICGIPPVCI